MFHRSSVMGVVMKEEKLDDFNVKNEPVLGYLPGSKERKELEAALEEMSSKVEDVPIIIGEKEYRTKEVKHQVMPHDHKKQLAKFY
ncbi:hypothetical protein GN156_20340, partial [bacterium LRH843]|nr:hypothetical protein [bacterium LRH843]